MAIGIAVALGGPASKVWAGSILGQVWFTDQIKLAQNPAPYGKTMGQWSALWQQWSLGQPRLTNPNFDETGAQAGNLQHAPVYFMPSTIALGSKVLPQNTQLLVKRNFVVPGNQPIFVFVSGVVADNTCQDPPLTVDGLRAAAEAQLSPLTEIHLTIDRHPIILATDRGDAVQNLPLTNYRVISPAFGFDLPADNIRMALSNCPVTGSVYPAVTEGWAVMLPPLLDGDHTIRLGATYGAPTNFTFDVENNVTAVRVTD